MLGNKAHFITFVKLILAMWLAWIQNNIYNLEKQKMPQLIPFYFVNEITFTFVIIVLTIYILSKYILPRFVRLFLSRSFIWKLLDK